MRDRRGFTLLEVVIAIVLMAIILIPLALIMIEYARSIAEADILTVTNNLGRREMAIIDTLDYNDPTLADGYDHTTENYNNSNFDLQRTVEERRPISNREMEKLINVIVYPHDSSQSILQLTTIKANVQFGTGAASLQCPIAAFNGNFFMAVNSSMWMVPGPDEWTPGVEYPMVEVNSEVTDMVLVNDSDSPVTITGIIMYGSYYATWGTIGSQYLFNFSFTGDPWSAGGTNPFSFSQPITINPGAHSETIALHTIRGYIIEYPHEITPGGGEWVFSPTEVDGTVTFQFVFSDNSRSPIYTWTHRITAPSVVPPSIVDSGSYERPSGPPDRVQFVPR